nr:MAG TPA_asm: hypothetical protein [Caudoviricetes sp.]
MPIARYCSTSSSALIATLVAFATLHPPYSQLNGLSVPCAHS